MSSIPPPEDDIFADLGLEKILHQSDAAEPPPPNPWNLVSHEDMVSPPKPVDWLCDAMKISYGNPTLFAGDPTSRKTLLAQHISVCVAAGKKVFGEWSVKQGNVGHLDYEMGPRLLVERFQRLARGSGYELSDLPRGSMQLGSIPSLFLGSDQSEEEFRRFVDGKVLVTIDSLRAGFGSVDENDSSKIIPILSMIQRVSEWAKCAVILIHHSKKKQGDADRGGTQWDDPSMLRGSGAIVGAAMGVFMFNGGDATNASKVSHVRERWFGRKLAPFRVHSHDVAGNEDPRWGLSVVSQLEVDCSDDDNEERDRDVDSKIVAFLSTLPARSFVGGVTALRAVMGGRQADISRRIHVLKHKGILSQCGDRKSPTFTLLA